MNPVRRFAQHPLIQNMLTLSGVQIASYIFPLLTIPYLARVLHADGWGLVAFDQAFGVYFTLLVEFGFSFSATREVSRHRDQPEHLARLVAGVSGAKAILTVASCLVVLLICPYVSLLRKYPLLLATSLFFAICQGWSPIWFFQGLERLRLMAGLDVLARALGTLAIFLFVHHPGDEWKVAGVQGLAAFLSLLIAYGITYKTVSFRVPYPREMWDCLHMGSEMFLFRSGVALYTSANTFILGLFAPPEIIGYFAGALRIVRSLLALLTPFTQSIYPRVIYLMVEAREKAYRLASWSTLALTAWGIVAGAGVLLTAPFLTHLLLGPRFDPAIHLMRLLALLLPIVAVYNALGTFWLLPCGRDRQLTHIVFEACLLSVGLSLALVSHFGASGIAIGTVLTEAYVIVRQWLGLKEEWSTMTESFMPIISRLRP